MRRWRCFSHSQVTLGGDRSVAALASPEGFAWRSAVPICGGPPGYSGTARRRPGRGGPRRPHGQLAHGASPGHHASALTSSAHHRASGFGGPASLCSLEAYHCRLYAAYRSKMVTPAVTPTFEVKRHRTSRHRDEYLAVFPGGYSASHFAGFAHCLLLQDWWLYLGGVYEEPTS
jgi:hypothetical protein